MKGAVGQIIHHESKNVLAVEQNKVLIPPQYNKYLSWGFSDLSVRIGHYESEKVSGCTISIKYFYSNQYLFSVDYIIDKSHHFGICLNNISNDF